MNWKPGPARCRSDEYSAHIVGFFDGFIVGVLSHKQLTTTTQQPFWWDEEGNAIGAIPTERAGLLPPKLSRDEVACQCKDIYYGTGPTVTGIAPMRAALDHYDQLRREGLCDE